MKTSRIALTVAAMVLLSAGSDRAASDTFGTGENIFEIDFVKIGNPGNPADSSGSPDPAGSVPYVYSIGKYGISEDMFNKAGLSITISNRGPNKPATGPSWFEAARYVNWLNTSTGRPAAYKFNQGAFELWQPTDAGYDSSNLYRNSRTRYVLPSVDEWYKAAYYDAENGVYFDYATGSDTLPTPVASGTDPGSAVYGQLYATGPADITQAGGLSPYGTMAQVGNANEWNETAGDLVNDTTPEGRIFRGGQWNGAMNSICCMTPNADPSLDWDTGLRIARLPEPSSLMLSLLGLLIMGLRNSPRKRR